MIFSRNNQNMDKINFHLLKKKIVLETTEMSIILNYYVSILLKEPFALKNLETVYFTSIFSTPSYSDIALIDNFDLIFFYFYFVFEVFDTIKF